MKRLNIRLADETAKRLEGLARKSECSQTVIIERLIMDRMPPDVQQASSQPSIGGLTVLQAAELDRIEDAVNEILIAVRAKQQQRQATASQAPSTQSAAVTRSMSDFQACTHCGRDGMISPKRLSTAACPDCSPAGHTDFASCPLCIRAKHAADAASRSSAADTSSIDFDPQFSQVR